MTSASSRTLHARHWLARHRVLAGLAIAVIGVTALWLAGRPRRSGAPGPASAVARPDAMQGMSGMSGMRADGTVHLTAAQRATFGVTFGTAERRMLATEVRAVGTVAMDESRMSTIAPKISGYVERLYVNTTGEAVRRGAPVAEVYSAELVAAEDELLVARRVDHAVSGSGVPGMPSQPGALLAAARRRLRLWDVSDAQIDEVLRTGRARRTVTVFAPSSGVVVDKKVTLGQAVQAGMPLYVLADLSAVWVDVQLRESEAGAVRVGATANLEFASYPGRVYKGRVSFVYPTLAEQSRSMRARVAVANGNGELKPGMYATVHLSSASRVALTVPRAAVIETGERAIVFVDRGGETLAPVVVSVGRASGENVEVLSGLAEGQRVVTSAQFLLDSESNLAEVMRGMIGMGAQGAAGAGSMAPPPSGGGGDMKGMQMPGADTRGMPAAVPAAKPR